MGFRYATGRLYKKKAVSADWWLSGGISPANCIAAYQAKGAADKAASLVNLTGNATYDLVENGTVNWDATNGWKDFGHWNAVGYFETGINTAGLSNSFTFIIHKNCSSYGAYILSNKPNDNYLTVNDSYTVYRLRWYGSDWQDKSVTTADNSIVGANTTIGFYENNVSLGSITAPGATEADNITIGRASTTGSPTLQNAYSAAFYNTNITVEQYLAVYTAMNAL